MHDMHGAIATSSCQLLQPLTYTLHAPFSPVPVLSSATKNGASVASTHPSMVAGAHLLRQFGRGGKPFVFFLIVLEDTVRVFDLTRPSWRQAPAPPTTPSMPPVS